MAFGAQFETEAHDHGLDVVIDQDCNRGIFHRRHDDGFVNKRIFSAAHLREVRAQGPFLCRRQHVDDEDFEIWPRVCPAFGRVFRGFGILLVSGFEADRDIPPAISAAGQCPHDARCKRRQFHEIAACEL